jgi:hypothetical protein
MSNYTHVLVKPFDLVTWGGVVEKLIGWWRNGPDGLNVEQPAKITDDDPGAFQSLMGLVSPQKN